jgi:hypothetical protein
MIYFATTYPVNRLLSVPNVVDCDTDWFAAMQT